MCKILPPRIFYYIYFILALACKHKQPCTIANTLDKKIEKLNLPPGFVAEHLYSPSQNNQGSWVSMVFEPDGNLIAADQFGSLYRLRMRPGGDKSKMFAEKLIVGQTDSLDSS